MQIEKLAENLGQGQDTIQAKGKGKESQRHTKSCAAQYILSLYNVSVLKCFLKRLHLYLFLRGLFGCLHLFCPHSESQKC